MVNLRGNKSFYFLKTATQWVIPLMFLGASATHAQHAVPGVIQAEDYDNFLDYSPGNSGGQYRADDVDIGGLNESLNGYYVTNIDDREWLQYDLDVKSAGEYVVDLRVASASSNGELYLRIDGKRVGETLFVSSTGGEESWGVASINIGMLSAGEHRLVVRIDGGGFNLDWLNISQGEFGLPGRIEAEDYDRYFDTTQDNLGGLYRNDGVDIGQSADEDGGFTVGWIASGEWLEYDVKITQAGDYTALARVSSEPGGGMFTLEVEGVTQGNAFVVDSTGRWQDYVTLEQSLGMLEAGSHQVRVQVQSGRFNLNWLEFERDDANPFPDPGPGPIVDQCDTTRECQDIWPNATDCLDSRSDESVCMCGDVRCDDEPDPTPEPTPEPTPFPTPDPFPSDQCDTTAECRASWPDATDCLNSGSDESVCMCGDVRCDAPPATPTPTPFPDPDPFPVDQCDTTAECRSIWPGATDCLNSGSDESVCMCGNQRCDDEDPLPDGTLGFFNIERDLVLNHHDNRADPDDIHAVAAWATMLADSRFQGVNYHAVMGTYGEQGGNFIDTTDLYNLAFGNNWSDAHGDRSGALDRVVELSIETLRDGGDVWIQEAGQSNFSADLVRRVKVEYPAADTRNDIHIIQHSEVNENNTADRDLEYVRAETDYRKIADGNSGGNGSPDFSTTSGSRWNQAESLPVVGEVWEAARDRANLAIDRDGHRNFSIAGGGMDFSDAVEVTWIFGFNNLDDVGDFFDEFPKNTTAPPPPPPPGDGSTYVEQNGLIVIDMESTDYPNNWDFESGSGAYGSGYIVWLGGDNFNNPGDGVISIPIRILSPGRYRFNFRNIIDEGSETTEANDTWVKIFADSFYGEKSNGDIVCPKGKPSSNRCSGDLPEGSSSNGWFKVYRTGGPANQFVWRAFTSDNDPHEVFAEFDSAGVYEMELSGRSNHHGIDRIVLYREGNASNNVSESFATSSSRPESPRE